jgi:hypothetical protein
MLPEAGLKFVPTRLNVCAIELVNGTWFPKDNVFGETFKNGLVETETVKLSNCANWLDAVL